MTTGNSPFRSVPSTFRDGIPVFTAEDDYVRNYEAIAGDHLASLSRGEGNPFIPEALWRELEDSTRELILRHAGGGRILDVGVGLGRLLGPLAGFERHGMDISMEYLVRAREGGIAVCHARIEDMPYREEFFDVVACTDVLEHVVDLNLCCGKILGVLKPGGILVVRVPYKENLECYLDRGYPYRYAHLRNFDEGSIRALFEKIFGCEFLCATMAGYRLADARLAWRLPWGQGMLLRLIYWSRRIGGEFHRSILRKAFLPVEFNAVFRKPARPGGAT